MFNWNNTKTKDENATKIARWHHASHITQGGFKRSRSVGFWLSFYVKTKACLESLHICYIISIDLSGGAECP